RGRVEAHHGPGGVLFLRRAFFLVVPGVRAHVPGADRVEDFTSAHRRRAEGAQLEISAPFLVHGVRVEGYRDIRVKPAADEDGTVGPGRGRVDVNALVLAAGELPEFRAGRSVAAVEPIVASGEVHLAARDRRRPLGVAGGLEWFLPRRLAV